MQGQSAWPLEMASVALRLWHCWESDEGKAMREITHMGSRTMIDAEMKTTYRRAIASTWKYHLQLSADSKYQPHPTTGISAVHRSS